MEFSDINTKENKGKSFGMQLKDLWEILTFNKFILILLVLSVGLIFFFIKISPPSNFESGLLLTIEQGSSVKSVATQLHDNNIIKSPTIFSLYIQFFGDSVVVAGDYLFDEKQNVFEVADRIINSDFGIPIVQVTITEGMTVNDIGIRMESRFPYFNREKFMNLALPYEGYLFPDTYRFSLNVSEEQVISTMRDNFNRRIEDLREAIEESGRSLHDIVTMASIVEREATRDTIQEVSDLLWQRMEIGMLLQVDATFVYSIGKNSFTVTRAQMRDPSDPFNTYVHPGLPPTPISNPGLATIKASIWSNPTEYLFFLTGRDGGMYFAVDHEGHLRNRRLFLD